MVLSKEETRRLYRSTAKFYDTALSVYRVFGVRRYRNLAIETLRMRPGDTVVDMGCGTGLNFELLYNAVGPEGRIIGVDLTDAMLARAARRIEAAGWKNVDLVEADLATYTIPAAISGAIGTFALEMVPEYDRVIDRAAGALAPGRRLALFGLKIAEDWPEPLIRLGVWLNKPFGASRAYASIRPWEAVRRHLHEVEFHEFYFGAAYLSIGEAI